MLTDIPARLDRLPWSRFHLLLVVALGITWILDGLEVTIVGSIGPVLQHAGTLNLSSAQLGAAASCYVFGAVGGALGSGWITDRHGRRRVFYLTLMVYLARGAAERALLEFPELCALPVDHRSGHRRRIRRGELGDR